MFYSKINASFPATKFYNVFGAINASNVTPFSQNNNTPIWNITNLAYDHDIDIYVKLNESQHRCLNVTYSNSSNKSGIIANTSFQRILENISILFQQKENINKTVNITMNGSDASNSTFLSALIVNEQFQLVNATSPFTSLNRNSDFRINFTSGNFTLLNNTFNMTSLFATYNYSTKINYKGIWNFWDFRNCSGRYIIKPVVFQAYCQRCVR